MKLNHKLAYLSLAIASTFAFATAQATTQNPSGNSQRILPFGSDKLAAKGYDIPEPFGVNINYMNIRQNVHVDQIGFSGLSLNMATLPGLGSLSALGNMPLPNSLLDIKSGHTRMTSSSTTLKLDAWLLPFFNVYALAGKTQGHSVSQVSVSTNSGAVAGALAGINTGIDQLHLSNADQVKTLLSGAIGTMLPTAPINTDFRLNFKGTTYGAGVVFTGGYKNFFALLDTNFTQTRFDVLDGHINTFTLTPRIGYSFTLPAGSIPTKAPGKINVWVGSMYQNTQQTYSGKISDLTLPASLQQMLMLTGNGRFEVRQHLASPWNALLGIDYAVSRNFNVTTEVGFAQRNSILLSGEFRF